MFKIVMCTMTILFVIALQILASAIKEVKVKLCMQAKHQSLIIKIL